MRARVPAAVLPKLLLCLNKFLQAWPTYGFGQVRHLPNSVRSPCIRRINWSNFQSFSDRLLTRPELFGEFAIDDHDRQRARRVVRAEEATALQRNSGRAEVIGTDGAIERERQIHVARLRAAFDTEAKFHTARR